MNASAATDLHDHGFAFLSAVYTEQEVKAMVDHMSAVDLSGTGVMRSADTYAVRQALRHVPALSKIIWNQPMKDVVNEVVGSNAFVCKSIWFDKPAGGNWFVGYHQDISICVDRKAEVDGFSRWTNKHGIIGVVPPVEVLQRILTLRIHLDPADATNGALQVKPGSHRRGILRGALEGSTQVPCPMSAGDVMLMRPLLLHASMRSNSDHPRRVLHLEVTNVELPSGLEWGERWLLEG